MIFLTRMDKQEMYVNPDHIISIEETPDTVITLFNGHHFIVMERADVIISRIVAYRARVRRRSGGTSGRKYLDRAKKSLFRSSTLNREIVCPDSRDEQQRSPFQGQEY
jgi:flagellar protein FlbD